MFNNYIQQGIKKLADKVLPSPRLYFIYAFLLIAAVWLSVANYFYFAEEYNNFRGAFYSGVICLVLASIIKIWDSYQQKNIKMENVPALQNNPTVKNDFLKDLIIDNYPFLMKMGENKIKELIFKRGSLKFIVAGFTIYTLFNFISSLKDYKNKY